jgi:signal transduction histidine kinase
MLKDCYPVSPEKRKIESEYLTDIHEAAQTIQKRSQGLLHFVDAYRNLTLIQKPSFQLFAVRELFLRVEKLMQANIKKKSIRLGVNIDPKTLELTADPELIEQVLINLLLNALQSVGGLKKAKIDLMAYLDGRGRIIIQVKDNGPGIDQENLEKIFIPFFSTKDKGSGIGLSLSRQIMRLHHGSITVQSSPNKQTVFTLRF